MIRKILVVDDSELLHRMYDLIFMRYRNGGPVLLHARNGSEAMSLVHAHRGIELILLDIDMPVMNGMQVLHKLRAAGWLQRLTVIMVSTAGREEDAATALASGASAYVTKPFTPSQLHDLISQRLGLPDAPASAASMGGR